MVVETAENQCTAHLRRAHRLVRMVRCVHFTTLDGATPKRAATLRQLSPPHIAATARSRRSFVTARLTFQLPTSEAGLMLKPLNRP